MPLRMPDTTQITMPAEVHAAVTTTVRAGTRQHQRPWHARSEE
jgi:hypothetical protein